MFKKILGKKKNNTSQEDAHNAELLEKISKMNLTEMRNYVNNKLSSLSLCEDGLSAVVEKLITYLHLDDMDTKKRKAFELILLLAKSQKMTFKTVDLIQKFVQDNLKLIQDYDTEHKEIYLSRFYDAIEIALKNINTRSTLKAKMDILGEND